MDQLTNQLKEARLLAEDADNKSDEVSRKLAFVEDELEVAEDRVKGQYSAKKPNALFERGTTKVGMPRSWNWRKN